MEDNNGFSPVAECPAIFCSDALLGASSGGIYVLVVAVGVMLEADTDAAVAL